MLKGFLGSISGAVSGLAEATGLKQFATKDVAEAAVGVVLKLAYADGELEAAEKAKISQIFEKSPLLAPFNKAWLFEARHRLMQSFDFDVLEGNEACNKEIREAAGFDLEARRALGRMAVMMAKADGDIEEAEKPAIREVFQMLNLDPAEAGVPGV